MTTNKQQNNEVDDRIYARNVPSALLQPYFDIKPISTTRCSIFPTVDIRPNNVQYVPSYNIQTTFNPGNRRAPWSGFSAKVQDESILRNQIYPLERSNNNTTYVPASSSDLYVSATDNNITPNSQPFQYLFKDDLLPPTNVATKQIDPHFFGNHTRQQLDDQF